jgi:hypothetical protein
MTNKIALDKAIKMLTKYEKGKIPKTRTEIQEIRAVREHLNGMMYEVKK